MKGHIINNRAYASELFTGYLNQARRNSVLAVISRKDSQLAAFHNIQNKVDRTKRFLGLQTINLYQITGSVNKPSEFDSSFRPRKRHLLDRWVNIYILAQANGWPPIQVYKVGDDYFVEDGHHRVSVGRFLGMDSIEAEVWEFATLPEMNKQRIQPDWQESPKPVVMSKAECC